MNLFNMILKIGLKPGLTHPIMKYYIKIEMKLKQIIY